MCVTIRGISNIKKRKTQSVIVLWQLKKSRTEQLSRASKTENKTQQQQKKLLNHAINEFIYILKTFTVTVTFSLYLSFYFPIFRKVVCDF